MAGYNPQRNRPRPTPAEDAPAPVDSLLGRPGSNSSHPDIESVIEPVDESVIEPVDEVLAETAGLQAPSNADAPRSTPTGTPAPTPVPSAPYIPTTPSAAQRSRSRLIMLGVGSVVALIAVVVLRRRRRS